MRRAIHHHPPQRPPMCGVKRTTAQSVPSGAFTAIQFDVEDYDTDSFHDNVTNNTRMVVPVAGVYHVWASVGFQANTTGTRIVRAYKNGTTEIGRVRFQATSVMSLQYSAEVILAVGDYIEIQVYQDSGGNLDVAGANADSDAFAAMTFMGSL